MFEFLAFITNKRYWKLHSLLIKVILRLYGIKVGKDFYIEGIPKLKIRGKPENIIIENNVSIMGNIDLRNRENGKIIFNDNVTIENDCRFVSAREGTIEIGKGSIVTVFAILNGGGDIIVGEKCILGPRCSINANDHVFMRQTPIRESGFIHAPIFIEDDCWLATNVSINKGVRLRKGTIVASGAVVTTSTEEYSVYGGIPAKKIGERA
jgi:acetyltransferase-like isoleucine patch superfamily enzyme